MTPNAPDGNLLLLVLILPLIFVVLPALLSLLLLMLTLFLTTHSLCEIAFNIAFDEQMEDFEVRCQNWSMLCCHHCHWSLLFL